MAKQQKTGHGGTRKYGRDKVKCERYKMLKRREKNKLKRVLQSNGVEAAKAYANLKGIVLKQS